MFKYLSRVVAFGALTLALATPVSASTYNFDYDGNIFDVQAVITTDVLDNVLSITGTVLGPANYSTTILNLVPTSSGLYHNLWIWNNLFTENTPHVDWYGLLWENLDGSVANFYFYNGEYVLSVANPGTGDYSFWANGDVGQPSVSEVPLPGAAGLLASGIMGFWWLGRQRKRISKDLR